ncbi:MAG: hypothetical protein DRJ64_01655 [Thermoprotei archaeon]|nr:MAG: hypothetical protein DRJ64_01655 [Thermoprotei archaeon]
MNKQLRTLDLSKFHFHSYGIVAADNPDNDKEIKVFPSEKLYYENGETIVKKGDLDKDEEYKPTTLKVKEKILKVTSDDIEPRHLIKENVMPLDKTKYLYADWCGLNNPNRYMPPNVCKGEKVIIYRYSNNDMYFWDTLGYELNLRKEDHVVDVYSDKPTIDEDNVMNGVDEDLEDTYYIIKSPRDKLIKIHTTDKYDELTTYDITLNTRDGFLEIIDGKGNFIKLDSDVEDLITNLNHDVITTIGNDKTLDIGNDRTTNIEHDDTTTIGNNETSSIGNDRATDIGNNDDETIGDTKTITLKKIAIKNDTTELIALLSEYIQTHIEEQHRGNLNIPTNLMPDSVAKFADIKARLDTLKV